ncbi:MAG: hypothetical protein LRY55_07265, partial [Leadbetterella sp.]|nr:hypothetical protein [Leadbetterella sp.]
YKPLLIAFLLGACSHFASAQTEKAGKSDPVSKADSLQKKLGDFGIDADADPKLSIGLPGGKGRTETLSSLVGETIPDLGLKDGIMLEVYQNLLNE